VNSASAYLSDGNDIVFRILGPIEVINTSGHSKVVGGRQQAVLAALLLRANQVVSMDRLAEAVWEDDPPSTARAQIQFCISALRRTFVRWRLRVYIETQNPGYRIRLDPGQLDSQVFARQVEAARQLSRAGRAADAATGLRGALSLWRGVPLEGESASLRAKTVHLEELRTDALRECLDVELELGRHRELVGELQTLVTTQPLDEGFRARLMVALARSGRRSEALEVYREGRSIIVEQLGLDPWEELRRLEAAILESDDMSLGLGAAQQQAASPAPQQVPRQLPADVADFTGRSELVRELGLLLAVTPGSLADQPEGDHPGDAHPLGARPALAVIAIAGKPGIGKSSLAVHVAHSVRPSGYPDGQLFADLRGSGRRPEEPAEVLGRFLRALGIPEGAVPHDEVERADLYRTMLADRRVLIVLDDAADEAQITPLLPGAPSCAVLVTSRRRLTGLAGAYQADVGLLPAEDTVHLLGGIIGQPRLAQAPAETRLLVGAVDGLPLAARLLGARLAAHPHWSLSAVAHRLRDESRVLDELEHNHRSVRGSLLSAYRTLRPEEGRLLGLLPAVEGADLPSWVAQAVLDAPERTADELLDGLVNAQLLDLAGDDVTHRSRYHLHSLVRSFVGEQRPFTAGAPLTAALRRVTSGWLAIAETAHERLVGRRVRPLTARRDQLWQPAPAYIEEATADPLAWFGSERANLLAAIDRAAECGLEELQANLLLITNAVFHAAATA
jgi:DNA-binding SARP family transcriptional activator